MGSYGDFQLASEKNTHTFRAFWVLRKRTESQKEGGIDKIKQIWVYVLHFLYYFFTSTLKINYLRAVLSNFC